MTERSQSREQIAGDDRAPSAVRRQSPHIEDVQGWAHLDSAISRTVIFSQLAASDASIARGGN